MNPVFKCLAQYYRHQEPPELHIAFFDIEVDFNTDKGYAPIDDPFSSITAITIYHQWTQELITLSPVSYTHLDVYKRQMLYDRMIHEAKKAGYSYIVSDFTRSLYAKSAWEKLAKRYSVKKLKDSDGDSYFRIDLQGK